MNFRNKKHPRLSQHIAFLKDFFRCYKDFDDIQIDTIEILLSKLYARFGITDTTDFSKKKSTDYPTMQDFYKLCDQEYQAYDSARKYLYTEQTLQEVCLGIHCIYKKTLDIFVRIWYNTNGKFFPLL